MAPWLSDRRQKVGSGNGTHLLGTGQSGTAPDACGGRPGRIGRTSGLVWGAAWQALRTMRLTGWPAAGAGLTWSRIKKVGVEGVLPDMIVGGAIRRGGHARGATPGREPRPGRIHRKPGLPCRGYGAVLGPSAGKAGGASPSRCPPADTSRPVPETRAPADPPPPWG